MKKVFLAAVTLISVAFVGTANAQATETDNVTVNIRLKPIHTIVVTGNQKIVDLVYDTKEKYNAGVSSTQTDHLTIFSTGGFVVNVKSGKFVNSATGSTPIDDQDAVKVQATNSSGNDLSVTSPTVTLSTSDQPFITSSLGGRDKKFSVTYSGAGGDAYLNKYDKDFTSEDGKNVYKATVTYTIVAD